MVVITGRTEPPDDPTAGDAGRRAVVSNARQEYRQHPALELLTSEEAYVSDALRQAGFALAESR